MTSLFPSAASPAPARQGWWGVATRPGSGLGFLPAALSQQPLATLAALLLAALAALAVSPPR